jgi:hypothetical protein
MLPAKTEMTVVRFAKRDDTVGETLLNMKLAKKKATVDERTPK